MRLPLPETIRYTSFIRPPFSNHREAAGFCGLGVFAVHGRERLPERFGIEPFVDDGHVPHPVFSRVYLLETVALHTGLEIILHVLSLIHI